MNREIHVAAGDVVTIIADGTSSAPPPIITPTPTPSPTPRPTPTPVNGVRLVWPWDGPQPARMESGPIDSNTAVITEFTTGSAVTPAPNMLCAVEAGDFGASVARVGCLSRIPGDFSGLDLGYGSLSGPSPNVTVPFAVGLSAPYAVRLEPNSPYFWNVKAAEPGDAAADCFVHLRKVGL